MAEDVIFRCPHCEQWLESPPDLIGLFVECPKCEAIVKVPSGAGEPSVKASEGKSPGASLRGSDADEEEKSKSATIRIQLPPNLGIPSPAPKKRFILRPPS